MTNNFICKEHSGFQARIKDLEANVSKIWERWDWMQKVVIGIFITLSLNLIGAIIIIIRMTVK